MWGGVGGYVGVGYRVGGGGVEWKGGCRKNFREISRKFRRGPCVKTDIVKRELKIF